jgi:hypothetical protein
MPNPISLRNIRPLNGKQSEGFEELCSQLARAEVPTGAYFVRKGAPDAGVECFAALTDGSEWGWQAKYFNRFTSTQWQELDESVEKALAKHPALVRYYVCVPLNRPDARIGKQQSTLQAWDNHVHKWTGWAARKGQVVEFVYWGESELLDRLAQPAHVGRVRFWFDACVFDEAWFAARQQAAIDTAGARYTPELSVELPIADVLDVFGRTQHFATGLRAQARAIREKFRYLFPDQQVLADPAILATYTELTEQLARLLPAIGRLDVTPTGTLPLSGLLEDCEAIDDLLIRLGELLFAASLALAQPPATRHGATDRDPFRELRQRLYQLREPLRQARHRFEQVLRITTAPVLVLTGEAGTGKTHLLCDVARHRQAASYPTVLLMGQQFTSTDDPWTQALRQLDLASASVEEVVGALEAAAQAAGSRLLLLIDALNEGKGRVIWPAHLAAFLAPLTRSPWIGVVLSVRSSYTEVVVPTPVLAEAYQVEHQGFAGQEYDAVRSFFLHYQLELPSTPLLAPEFSNPLFLKTLCQGLQTTGQTRLPRGLHGITATFHQYLDGVNAVLSRQLGYHTKLNLVRRALREFAQATARTDERWLPLSAALALLQHLLPSQHHDQSLYHGLVVEGVLTEEAGYDEHEEVVFIAYERLADHLFIENRLNEHLDATNPAASFAAGQPLAELCDSHRYFHEGEMEALFIQIPERTGRELSELLPAVLDEEYSSAFRQSIIWRDTTAFSAATRQALNEFTAADSGVTQTWETLLTVASLPEHPLNAEFLDQHLRPLELPERDGWWSIKLADWWEEPGALHRLVDWATGVVSATQLDDQAVSLCAITLAWLFTSPDRFLRDRATKALANLLTGRLAAATRLVERFATVNDPYVAERVYAAAYGAVMRNSGLAGVELLATRVYELVFAPGTPPVHLLLRDYARGIVERALYLGIESSIDASRIRPPYTSTWPVILSQTELDALVPKKAGRWQNDTDPGEWARHRVKYSVEHDDFGRYVVDSAVRGWLATPLTAIPQMRLPSNERLLAGFVAGLAEPGRAAWVAYEQADDVAQQAADEHFRRLAAAHPNGDFLVLPFAQQTPEAEALWEQAEELASAEHLAVDAAYQALLAVLTPEQAQQLTAIEERPEPVYEERRKPEFDSALAYRYIVGRALALGDTFELVGHFDQHVSGEGRSAHKAERVGKKYQWIALHEFLAYLADHYEFSPCLMSEDEAAPPYDGPWQPGVRDLDPSNILRATAARTTWLAHAPAWWGPAWPAEWHQPAGPADWLIEWRDLPPVPPLLRMQYPGSTTTWLNLDGSFNWAEPLPPDLDSDGVERRRCFYFATAYLVRATEEAAFLTWVRTHPAERWSTPEPGRVSEQFLGEHGWAAASRYYQADPALGGAWERPRGQCPAQVQVLAARYLAEPGNTDCSLDKIISLNLVRAELLQPLGLRWMGTGADFADEHGQLAAFDPTLTTPGPSTLLVREDLLRDFLAREQLSLCWVVTGQKQVLSANLGGSYLGQLSVSGAYSLTEHGVAGFLNCYLERARHHEQGHDRLVHTISIP